MVMLNNSLNAWGTEGFSAALKAELEELRSDVLPIAQAVEPGNRLDDSDLGVIVNGVSEDARHVYATVGVFFAQVVECVSCGGGDGWVAVTSMSGRLASRSGRQARHEEQLRMCIGIYIALFGLLIFYGDYVMEQYGLAAISGPDSAPMVVALGWEMVAPLWPLVALGALAGSAVTALVLRKGRSCATGACAVPSAPQDAPADDRPG